MGILGLGAISGIYLKNLTGLFKEVEVIGVYDLIPEKTAQAQKEYGIPKAYTSMEEMLQDEEVEIVLNLTRPFEHYATTKAALLAGKHVYSERLAATWKKARSWLPWPGKKDCFSQERLIPSWGRRSRPAVSSLTMALSAGP
ncbi:MAG: Gfo/Idh/MocA family protein [Eisenbergiella massiliensis]